MLIVVIAIGLTWLWSLRNQHTYFKMEDQHFSLVPENNYKIGQKIDSLNGVYVYYNGTTKNTSGQSSASDGYKYGQQYQDVEFVRKYYYEQLKYKMPNSSVKAIDYFDKALKDGDNNEDRGLTQFNNPSDTKPRLDDIIIYNSSSSSQYGHVAIVSGIMDKTIEIIQQNPGVNISSRAIYSLEQKNGKWKINNHRILGWLRK